MSANDRRAPSTPPPPALDPWEEAYRRFESPAEAERKMARRLVRLGARAWARDAAILEVCCGAGYGLGALAGLGFTRVRGIDLSPRLLARVASPRPGALCVADCRALPFAGRSFDFAIVQGGLHHLPSLPGDLAATCDEVRRVLRPGGRFVVVEPWQTPFLAAVHALSRRRLVRRVSGRMDAFERMAELEAETYWPWLARPREILAVLHARFTAEREERRLGKLWFVGRPR